MRPSSSSLVPLQGCRWLKLFKAAGRWSLSWRAVEASGNVISLTGNQVRAPFIHVWSLIDTSETVLSYCRSPQVEHQMQWHHVVYLIKNNCDKWIASLSSPVKIKLDGWIIKYPAKCFISWWVTDPRKIVGRSKTGLNVFFVLSHHTVTCIYDHRSHNLIHFKTKYD